MRQLLALAAAGLLLIGSAHAQPAVYTLQIPPNSLAIIGHALDQMPYGMVAGVVADISAQKARQDMPPPAPITKSKPKPSAHGK